MALSDKIAADLDAANATTSGGRVTVLPDAKGGSSATDAIGSNGPTLGTSNGQTIMTFDGSRHLAWPMGGANNHTTLFGFALWLKTTSVASSFGEPFASWIGNSGRRLNITRNLANLQIYTGPDDPSDVYETGSFFTANTWHFVYVSYDTSDQVRVWTVSAGSAVEKSLTATTGDGVISDPLPATTGNYRIGAYDASDTDGWTGDIGRHIYTLNAVLTTAEIVALSGIHSPEGMPTVSASGAVTAPKPTASGSSVVPVLSSGAPTAPRPTASGAAAVLVTTNGSPTAPSLAASGNVLATTSALGTPVAPSPTAAGSVTLVPAAFGAITTPSAAAAGSVSIQVAAAGAAALPAPSASGAAATVIQASGAATAPALSAAGAAATALTVTGEVETWVAMPRTAASTATLVSRVLCYGQLIAGVDTEVQ